MLDKNVILLYNLVALWICSTSKWL